MAANGARSYVSLSTRSFIFTGHVKTRAGGKNRRHDRHVWLHFFSGRWPEDLTPYIYIYTTPASYPGDAKGFRYRFLDLGIGNSTILCQMRAFCAKEISFKPQFASVKRETARDQQNSKKQFWNEALLNFKYTYMHVKTHSNGYALAWTRLSFTAWTSLSIILFSQDNNVVQSSLL